MECYDKLARSLADTTRRARSFEERNALRPWPLYGRSPNGLDMDRGQIYHLGA